MSYLARLKARMEEKSSQQEPTKPTKGGSVSFVSAAPLASRLHATPSGLPELFAFAPGSDPLNDAEAIEERACIIAEGAGIPYPQALQEARWQAHREHAWRVFLANAKRILHAPKAERAGLLERYRKEAERRYGTDTAAFMLRSMQSWLAGQMA